MLNREVEKPCIRIPSLIREYTEYLYCDQVTDDILSVSVGAN